MNHVNTHQRVPITKKNFNNQEDRITHSVDTSQSSSLVILVITQGTQCHFCCWQDDYIGPLTSWKGQLSVLTSMDTLHIYFSFLHTMLLPKLLRYLHNALTTITVSYIPLLLVKEFHPEQKKSGPMLIEFTGLIMLPTILKQLA